jgi:hypothetical protein
MAAGNSHVLSDSARDINSTAGYENISVDLPIDEDLSGEHVNVAVYGSRDFGQ